MTELETKMYAILNEKLEKIKPENIRKDINIFGIQGNLEPDKPDQTKTATPTTSQQVIEPDTGYELSSVTVNAVTNAIDQNIVAGNIKKDVEILGVTGTYDPPNKLNIYAESNDANSWEILNDEIPYKYLSGYTVVYGNDVYLIGGYNYSSPPKNFYKYNITTGEYTRLQDLPYKFNTCCAILIGSDIYMMGLDDGKKCIKYNILTETFTTLSSLPAECSYTPMVEYGTDIYIFGLNSYPSSDNMLNVYKYDTLANSYTKLNNMPYKAGYNSATRVGDFIYIFPSINNKRLVLKYDINNDSYTRLNDTPYDCYSCPSILLDNYIYIFGADSSSSNPKCFYKYDYLNDSYTQLTDMPYVGFNTNAVVINGKLYLFGGGTSNKTDVTQLKVRYYNFTYTEPSPKKGLWIKLNAKFDRVITDNNVSSKTYSNKSIIIENGDTYSTEIVTTDVVNGLPYKFDNFYYYNNGLDTTTNKYYGDGTQWVQIV